MHAARKALLSGLECDPSDAILFVHAALLRGDRARVGIITRAPHHKDMHLYAAVPNTLERLSPGVFSLIRPQRPRYRWVAVGAPHGATCEIIELSEFDDGHQQDMRLDYLWRASYSHLWLYEPDKWSTPNNGATWVALLRALERGKKLSGDMAARVVVTPVSTGKVG
jgi:hypothetical protein